MTLVIDSDEYEELCEFSCAGVRLERSEVILRDLKLWDTVSLKSVKYEDLPELVAVITAIEDDAMDCVLSLQRLRFNWTYVNEELSYCQVNETVRLHALAATFDPFAIEQTWSATIWGYDTRTISNLTHRTQAQLKAEAMLLELTHELCRMFGGIFCFP